MPRRREWDVDRAREMRREGLSAAHIARELGVGVGAVRSWMRREGLASDAVLAKARGVSYGQLRPAAVEVTVPPGLTKIKDRPPRDPPPRDGPRDGPAVRWVEPQPPAPPPAPAPAGPGTEVELVLRVRVALGDGQSPGEALRSAVVRELERWTREAGA